MDVHAKMQVNGSIEARYQQVKSAHFHNAHCHSTVFGRALTTPCRWKVIYLCPHLQLCYELDKSSSKTISTLRDFTYIHTVTSDSLHGVLEKIYKHHTFYHFSIYAI